MDPGKGSRHYWSRWQCNWFNVDTLWSAPLMVVRDRPARFGNELLRGLVEANQRAIAVAWPRVDGQHVFHSGYERAVGLRRDDPVLAAMGLKSVFLSARPIV